MLTWGNPMYTFKDDVNDGLFFQMQKEWFESRRWASLSAASKAVLPVIGVHCDEKGLAFPGERTIAILAGRSDKIVRQGIKELTAIPGFTVEEYITSRGKFGKRFHLVLPDPSRKRTTFPFYKAVIEGGTWRQLKPSAQAVYPVLRFFARFKHEAYAEIDDSYPGNDQGAASDALLKHFQGRNYDLCEAEVRVLVEYTGINRRSIQEAFRSLEDNGLVEVVTLHEFGFKGWKVYRRPAFYPDPEDLNRQVRNSYRYAESDISREKTTVRLPVDETEQMKKMDPKRENTTAEVLREELREYQ